MSQTKHKVTHIITSPTRPHRLVLNVGTVIAICIMGDSLMYSILPLEAENLGIPLALVGVLLSANRIIRLLSNSWASRLFERLGPRWPFIGSAVLGLLTTLLYGSGWGFVVFLLARAGWGISWSGLRQGGYQAIWGGSEAVRGRLMGLLWGVVRVGSAVSVLLGGYLRDRYGFPVAIGVIAAITALGIPAALSIRWPKAKALPTDRPTTQGWRFAFQTAPQRWLMAVGFLDTLFEGILGATASLFLAKRLGGDSLLDFGIGIGTVAGILLALRYISGLVFGPLIGALSDRLGQPRTMVLTCLVFVVGTTGAVTLPDLYALLCLALVFIALSGTFVTANASASGIANRTQRPHLFVGAFSTAIDAGAAVGPLLSYSLGEFTGFEPLYVVTSVLVLLAALRYWQVEGKSEMETVN